MRPVHRGPRPSDEAGRPVIFDHHSHARPQLIQRLGDYCSFCELPVASIAVEHIRCKVRNPVLEREWENFLLACLSCNSSKGTAIDTSADVERHLWPHRHRSGDAFIYSEGGVVRLVATADPEFNARAAATEVLVGLTRRPGHGLTPEQILRGSDRRYQKRSEAWDEAMEAREDLRQADTPKMRRLVLRLARVCGFWSVWMTVFADDASMQSALCAVFSGTAQDRVYPLPPHMEPVENAAITVPGVQSDSGILPGDSIAATNNDAPHSSVLMPDPIAVSPDAGAQTGMGVIGVLPGAAVAAADFVIKTEHDVLTTTEI